MASAETENKYTSISTLEDLDLENDSDTTLASPRFLGQPISKNTKAASRTARVQTALTWLRWASIFALQCVIIILFLVKPSQRAEACSLDGTETGGDVNGLYKPKSHTYTLLTAEESTYVPDMSSDENRMAVRGNWDKLMPLGSGSVEIPDYEQHPMLGLPIIDDPARTGALFEASWTHALHCLYYTVDSYHQLVVHNGSRFGFDGDRNDYHAAHCFEYLRNQILCMADMTLEGSQSVLDATGEGQAHMCRNREEAIEWIEERRVDDVQSIVGP